MENKTVRKLDQHGRVVIPAPIRKRFGVGHRDTFEMVHPMPRALDELGRLVIPAEVLRANDVKPGERIGVEVRGDSLIMTLPNGTEVLWQRPARDQRGQEKVA